jgi:hypothetical protein
MIAIGTYVLLKQADGIITPYRFQNFHAGESRTFQGLPYMFAGFGFSGGTLDLQGANISASMVFAVNALDLNVFKQAADERWIAQINTVWLDPDTLEETDNYSSEVYQIVGFEHDSSRLQVRLGSPLDAVVADTPRRTLTQSLVGALPSTGNISLN